MGSMARQNPQPYDMNSTTIGPVPSKTSWRNVASVTVLIVSELEEEVCIWLELRNCPLSSDSIQTKNLKMEEACNDNRPIPLLNMSELLSERCGNATFAIFQPATWKHVPCKIHSRSTEKPKARLTIRWQ